MMAGGESDKSAHARVRVNSCCRRSTRCRSPATSAPSCSAQFREQVAYERVDQEFFEELLTAICGTQAELETNIDKLIDRPLEQLDPVELGILLIGVYELESRVATFPTGSSSTKA